MKNPCNDIRSWLYSVLNGKITYNSATVPVYSIPPTSATYPHILLGDIEWEPVSRNKDCDIYDVMTEIIAVTKYTGVMASYGAADSITDDVLEEILSSTTAITNYDLIESLISRGKTAVEQIDTGFIVTHKIILTLKIEEE